MDIDSINALDNTRFVQQFGSIFEHSPWVAQAASEKRPFEDRHALHAAMVDAAKNARLEQQLALLRAHPQLAGREAQAGELTAASRGEQQSAGLNALNATDMAAIAELNKTYLKRFGFPFIIAVRRHTLASLFDQWQQRLEQDPATEIATALDEVYEIARIRLAALFGGSE